MVSSVKISEMSFGIRKVLVNENQQSNSVGLHIFKYHRSENNIVKFSELPVTIKAVSGFAVFVRYQSY